MLAGLGILAASGVSPTRAAGDVVLSVTGRTNSTPSVVASRSFVAVAWGAAIEGRADVFAAVSRNGGETFGPPVRVNALSGEARLGGELPPRVSLIRTGQAEPEIAVVWTARGDTTSIKAARSRDGGRTFAPPVVVQTVGAPGDRGWPALTTDDSGGVHAIWLDHRGLETAAAAGDTGGSRRHAGTHDGVAMAQLSALYHERLGDAPAERILTRGVCYCCKTALAAGPNGTVAAAWRHVYPGNVRDIALSLSRDRGRSFPEPVRVSADGWAIDGCPDDGPAVAIDREGTIHVVWPTVLGGDTPEGALFYAVSRDGRTFSPRVRVPTLGSPRPMHPQIALGADGRIAVAWDELAGGGRVAALREWKPHTPEGGRWGDVVRLSHDEPGAYPVLAWTDRGLLAVWTAGTSRDTVVKVRRIEAF